MVNWYPDNTTLPTREHCTSRLTTHRYVSTGCHPSRGDNRGRVAPDMSEDSPHSDARAPTWVYFCSTSVLIWTSEFASVMSPAKLAIESSVILQRTAIRDPRLLSWPIFPPCPSPFRRCAARLVEGQEIEFERNAYFGVYSSSQCDWITVTGDNDNAMTVYVSKSISPTHK